MNDESYMRMALSLARRGLGRTAPNPAVGCVLVKDGRIVGRGWTQPCGRPHAEAVALAQARDAAQGATAYVTLEPCAHHGVTPPCAEALIAAGIRRCVIACSDPDPRTAGKGIMALSSAGIETVTRVCEDEARALNAGFFSRIERQRPWVTLKLATSLDGCIATAAGESQWITGEAARQHAHLLRAQHDAILTGIGTVLADDPQLTCRLPGMEDRSPIRIVLDSQLRLPEHSALVRSALRTPLWVMTKASASAALERAGVRIFLLPELIPATVLSALASEGVTRLLVEAGPRVSTSFYESEMVDEICWYRAPLVIGAGGKQAVQPFAQPLRALSHWHVIREAILGTDRVLWLQP
jgi:diaminohydroxyphosphoribosylaminopyrimidine deaminase/5-amino-6-(5-phosphoribosylamino)uracil reductase